MRRNLLVTDIDDPNALVNTPVIDVDDVAAAKRKYRINTFVLQCLGDQMAARDDSRLTALLLQGVLSRSRSRLHWQGIYGRHTLLQ
jgi:hypothetical protein